MSMTTHVFSTSYHSNFGNGVSLADEEFLYVGAGATLSSGNATAAWGSGNYHLIDIFGNVVGDYSGLWLQGSGNVVRIQAGAQAYGGRATGISLEGTSQQVDNGGYIYGSLYGAEIYSTGPGEGSTITNKGTIEGYYVGVRHGSDSVAGETYDNLKLINSGTVRSLKGGVSFQSADGAGLVDEIVNTGTMLGSILLGDGTDTIDTSRGTVVGVIELGKGEDYAIGSAVADTIRGGDDDDFIRGGGGKDRLEGGFGRDLADYSDKTKAVQVTLNGGTVISVKVNGVVEDLISDFEGVFGGRGADRITGDSFGNLLTGGGGNDTVAGGGGHDTVGGGAGRDVLTGGAGKDQFTFDTRPGATHTDTITDFSHRDDVIGLDGMIFAALTGPFSVAQFRASPVGHAATTASQRIIYDKSNGTLWYDADGNGSQAAVQFATLTNKPTDLSHNDFYRFDVA
jgi:Ca2+-binding RTX toxin-like protein